MSKRASGRSSVEGSYGQPPSVRPDSVNPLYTPGPAAHTPRVPHPDMPATFAPRGVPTPSASSLMNASRGVSVVPEISEHHDTPSLNNTSVMSEVRRPRSTSTRPLISKSISMASPPKANKKCGPKNKTEKPKPKPRRGGCCVARQMSHSSMPIQEFQHISEGDYSSTTYISSREASPGPEVDISKNPSQAPTHERLSVASLKSGSVQTRRREGSIPYSHSVQSNAHTRKISVPAISKEGNASDSEPLEYVYIDVKDPRIIELQNDEILKSYTVWRTPGSPGASNSSQSFASKPSKLTNIPQTDASIQELIQEQIERIEEQLEVIHTAKCEESCSKKHKHSYQHTHCQTNESCRSHRYSDRGHGHSHRDGYNTPGHTDRCQGCYSARHGDTYAKGSNRSLGADRCSKDECRGLHSDRCYHSHGHSHYHSDRYQQGSKVADRCSKEDCNTPHTYLCDKEDCIMPHSDRYHKGDSRHSRGHTDRPGGHCYREGCNSRCHSHTDRYHKDSQSPGHTDRCHYRGGIPRDNTGHSPCLSTAGCSHTPVCPENTGGCSSRCRSPIAKYHMDTMDRCHPYHSSGICHNLAHKDCVPMRDEVIEVEHTDSGTPRGKKARKRRGSQGSYVEEVVTTVVENAEHPVVGQYLKRALPSQDGPQAMRLGSYTIVHEDKPGYYVDNLSTNLSACSPSHPHEDLELARPPSTSYKVSSHHSHPTESQRHRSKNASVPPSRSSQPKPDLSYDGTHSMPSQQKSKGDSSKLDHPSNQPVLQQPGPNKKDKDRRSKPCYDKRKYIQKRNELREFGYEDDDEFGQLKPKFMWIGPRTTNRKSPLSRWASGVPKDKGDDFVMRSTKYINEHKGKF